MTHYTIPNLHSIFILTLYIFLASYDNKLKLINAEITENRDYTINELMNDPDNQYLGVTKESTISVQVPQPEPQLTELVALYNQVYTPTSPYIGYSKVTVNVPRVINELLQNKRIQTSGNYTIESLMTNPSEYQGIYKNSNIIVDIPELDITQISNYSITQNGTQTVPIPSGYDAVDSISLNVQVPMKIYIDRIGYEDGTFLFSNFSINSTDNYIGVPSHYMFFNFVIYNNTIRYKLYINNTQGNLNIRPYVNTSTHQGYYIVADYASVVVESVSLRTSSNEPVILITDPDATDSKAVDGYVYRQFIDFIVPT